MKRTIVITTARSRITPITMPTIAPVEMPLFELDGFVETGVEVDEVWAELLWVLVDEGEVLSRQLTSLEFPTLMIFELPPCCP